jgi:Protein tyrosine and serine/threonine kinase
MKEVSTLAQATAPNVCQFLGACLAGNQLMIVLELCTGGNVETLVQSHTADLSMLQLVRMMEEASRGLRWLHEMPSRVVHREYVVVVGGLCWLLLADISPFSFLHFCRFKASNRPTSCSKTRSRARSKFASTFFLPFVLSHQLVFLT